MVEQPQPLQTENSRDDLPQTDVGDERAYERAVERSASASDAGLAAESNSKQPMSSLTETVRSSSEALKQAQQPFQLAANSNPTDNAEANASPASIQPSATATARVLPVDRGGGEWGQLREQAVDDLLESRRDSLVPRYQKQIDAYFRQLAEQGRE